MFNKTWFNLLNILLTISSSCLSFKIIENPQIYRIYKSPRLNSKNKQIMENFMSKIKKTENSRINIKKNDSIGLDLDATDNLIPKYTNDLSRPKSNLTLDLSQLKPFLKIAVPFFKEDKTARDSLIAVIALTLLNSGISVVFSYISRDFYNALNARDEALFYEKIGLFFAALVVAVPVSVYYRYNREKLSLYWREGLTKRVLEQYYSNRTFYIIETLRDIDNPDQRISDDVNAFTKTSLAFFITLFTSVVDLFSFSSILFEIYPGLFLAIILYAFIGSIITTNLGQSLVGLNYEKLQKEANFRFSLIRTRENAEAIAFYDSNAELERANILKLFEKVLVNKLDILGVQRNLEYFTTSYRYLVQILPSLIVAPLYFAKKIELGAISQSYGAFNHILSDFSLIINSFEELSAFSAGLTRLTTFLDRINDGGGWEQQVLMSDQIGSNFEKNDVNSSYPIFSPYDMIKMNSVSETTQKDQPILICSNLTLLTPDRHRILLGGEMIQEEGLHLHYEKGINVKINKGDRILIVGKSGCGKTSLLRAIAGLWKFGEGEISWYIPSDQRSAGGSVKSAVSEMRQDMDVAPKGVFFLPQKPYNIPGSLRLQITYPLSLNDSNHLIGPDLDDEILSILKLVRLGDLASRMGEGDETAGLNSDFDWSKILSLGEQQRLSFARAIFNNPSVIILDESTSALDLDSEKAMYEVLMNKGITYISVGHRPSLLSFHDKKLVLYGPGEKAEVFPILSGSNLSF